MILGGGLLPGSDGELGAAPVLIQPVAFTTPASLLLRQLPDPVYSGPFDQFGTATIPLAAPQPGQPVTDATLGLYLAFLKAFLVTDANAVNAWQAVAPGTQPVVGTFTHNPSDTAPDRGVVFNTRDLPAIFMWREASSFERPYDAWHVETADVTMLWVFPLGAQENQRVRMPFVSGLAKAIYVALERGRTPGFVVAGDTDPLAARQGSQVHSFTNAIRISMKSWRRARVNIDMLDKSATQQFAGIEMKIHLEEKLDYSLDRYAPLLGTQITVTAPDGTVLYVGKAP